MPKLTSVRTIAEFRPTIPAFSMHSKFCFCRKKRDHEGKIVKHRVCFYLKIHMDLGGSGRRPHDTMILVPTEETYGRATKHQWANPIQKKVVEILSGQFLQKIPSDANGILVLVSRVWIALQERRRNSVLCSFFFFERL